MIMPDSICPLHFRKLRYPLCREACWFEYAKLNPIVRYSSSATASFNTSPSLSLTLHPTTDIDYGHSEFASADAEIQYFTQNSFVEDLELSDTIDSKRYPRDSQIMPFTSAPAVAMGGLTTKSASPTPEADLKRRNAPIDGASEEMPTKKPRTKARTYVRSEMISILAGSEQCSFYVHENRLLEESGDIASQFVERFGSSTKELKLLDTPVVAVEVLVDYLYHDNFACSATWEPTTTLEPFLHAWMLADKLGMEDAKNAIMDRLRFTVDKANTYELEGAADVALVHEAVLTMQSMVPQPRRWCPLYAFLIHRLVKPLAKERKDFDTTVPAYQEQSFKKILHNGGDIVVDIIEGYFKAKSSGSSDSQPDPACLKGCHYHDHTLGRESRVCSGLSASKPINVASESSTLKTEPSSSAKPSLFNDRTPTSTALGSFNASPQSADPSTAMLGSAARFSIPSAIGGGPIARPFSTQASAGFSSNTSPKSPFDIGPRPKA